MSATPRPPSDDPSVGLPDIDEVAFTSDPYPWYARMRRDAPVTRVPGRDWYFVTTMELVREVLADPGTYSSQVAKGAPPSPEVAAETARLRRGLPTPISPLLSSDPPEHTTYRRMANRAFTPRALAWMEDSVRNCAESLAQDLPRETDFVESFAVPLPVYAICRILGLGGEHRDSVRRWTDAATARVGRTPGEERQIAAERDLAEFDRVILAELDLRRHDPGQDLLTRLVQAADDAVAAELRAPALLGLVGQLLVAGNETTTRLLTECVALLHEHPEEWQRLRDDPGRASSLIEEALRLASPVQQMLRRTTRDTVLGGVHLAKGTTLLVSFASANRDESVFPDPDRFLPDRPSPGGHVAFGHGAHACLGSGLARLEGRVALSVLAERTRAVEVLPHEPEYLASYLLRGRTTLPVRVRRTSWA